MRRLISIAFVLVCATPATAQQLSGRVSAVGSGQAYFSYAARPDVCGDGHTVILRWLGSGAEMFLVSPEWGMVSGTWDMRHQSCTHSPVRVQLTVAAGQVRTLWPAVGATGGGRGRDLGTVGNEEAVDFLFQLARTASEDVSGCALLAAALADSARISPRLIAMAEDRRLDPINREQALKWVERTAVRDGDTGADARVRAIAVDESEAITVRERAIRVVAQPAGDAFLRDLYGRVSQLQLKDRMIRELAESPLPGNRDWIERVARNAGETVALRDRAIRVIGEELHDTRRLQALYAELTPVDLKDRVIRVVGEAGSGDGIAWLKAIATNQAEPLEARERALRVLGEQLETPYLHHVYEDLRNTQLQDRVLRALGEAGGADNVQFVRRVALDSSAAPDLRDRALRVLSEAGLATRDLIALYDTIRDPDLRDRLIRLLAERGDRDARTKLADIAANDPNPDLRHRAQRQRIN